uniref:Protein FAM184A/B N-terminal domain-containing protein n=1 Tax=Globodera rostochiensis TaxID=31243 RepID=A0A914HE56_GLORO
MGGQSISRPLSHSCLGHLTHFASIEAENREQRPIGCDVMENSSSRSAIVTPPMNRLSDRPGSSLQPMPSNSSSPPSISFSRTAIAPVEPFPHQNSPHSERPSAHSPCPAICSWPAPPPNPRAELKPTAIAAPLTTPPTSSARSTLLNAIPPQQSFSNTHLQLQNPISSQSPCSKSSQPSPIALLDSVPLLTMFRAASLNSAPPGGNSPISHWGRETELRQKIQSLEEIVADYERQKLNVLGTFTDFSEKVSERESEEVLGAKKDFDERMKSFQMLQEQFEREKEQALEKLRQDHQREIQALEQRFSHSQLMNLEKKYIKEIQKLEEERNELRTERERLGEEFKGKLRRAESLFEMELTAARMLYMRELQALREHEEALKDEMTARQEESHDRLMEQQYQSRQSKDELVHCREEMAQLERALGQKADEIHRLSKELAIARRQTEEAIRRLGQIEAKAEEFVRELSAQKERAEQLRGAEEAREQLEETVRELRKELTMLRSRADMLEVERDELRAQGESQAQLHDSQVTALEAMLKSVTSEKEGNEQRCQEMLDRERAEAEERELILRREFSAKLGELEEQYNGLRVHVERDNIEPFGPENVKLWEEIECLRSEKGELERELSAERTAQQYDTDGLTKLARAIQSLKRSTICEKSSDEEEVVEEVEGWERVPPVEALLEKLEQLKRSVEGIVREKRKMETRLELLGEAEFNWLKRLTEMERELEEQRERTTKAEEDHRQTKQSKELQIVTLKPKLEERKDKAAPFVPDETRNRTEELETKLREAKKRAETIEAEMEKAIGKLEEEHAMEMEAKIDKLNREHERTVELMMQREREMEEELEELRIWKRNARDERTEIAEGETQTDPGGGEGKAEELKIWKRDARDERTEIAEGETQTDPGGGEGEAERAPFREKDELIRKLKEDLEEAKCGKNPSTSKEGGRSQSIAFVGEHFLMCQKAIDEGGKEEKKEGGRRPDFLKGFEQRKVQSPTQLSRMDATMPRDVLPTQRSSQSTTSTPTSQRSLLSPGGAQQQRASPARQIVPMGKNGRSNGSGEKRPAWKF